MNSTPLGYRHMWKYKGVWDEKKIKPGLWRIKFRATKGKGSKGYGGFKKGFKIHWKIKADQYAVKTGKGQYQTLMVGTKRQISTKSPKRFKYLRRYRR